MKVRKGGIFTTIESKDFGIYQKAGFVKVVDEPLQKLEEIKVEDEPIVEVVEEEPITIKEVAQEEPIEEVEVEDEMPKPKKNRKK